jgi:hypothetical protein
LYPQVLPYNTLGGSEIIFSAWGCEKVFGQRVSPRDFTRISTTIPTILNQEYNASTNTIKLNLRESGFASKELSSYLQGQMIAFKTAGLSLHKNTRHFELSYFIIQYIV